MIPVIASKPCDPSPWHGKVTPGAGQVCLVWVPIKFLPQKKNICKRKTLQVTLKCNIALTRVTVIYKKLNGAEGVHTH